MSEYRINAVPLTWNQKIKFECSMCGSCCRHVRESVPIESLDAYRLALYFRDSGNDAACVDEILSQYTIPVLLDECGYFLYVLKTTGSDDACIFLKDNRCMVQAAKPRACRTYPLLAEPNGSGSFNYHLSMEKPHHFKGRSMKARDWMKRYFTPEDRAFVNEDIETAIKIAKLLRKIPETRKSEAMFHFLRYQYSDFDLDQPFQAQFEQNHKLLLAELEKLAHE